MLTAALAMIATAIALVKGCDPPYGALSVKGANLVDSSGTARQLRGLSLFWSQWMPQFYNEETVKAIKCSFNANVVRAAMAVTDGGYLTNPSAELAKVKAVIDAAIKNCIYVIVDWHEEQAPSHLADSKKFFAEIAKQYGNSPNIIYELYNEPNGPQWPEIKQYCQDVIPVIRNAGANNIIICGTPKWDQQLGDAANNPITGSTATNVMYTLHFYAGTHKQDLRDVAQQAIDKGLPIFITEYGCTNADASSNLDKAECQKWWDFAEKNKLSFLDWAVADKNEAAAILKPGTTAAQVGDDSALTESGKFVKDYLKSKDNGVSCSGGGSATIATTKKSATTATTKKSATTTRRGGSGGNSGSGSVSVSSSVSSQWGSGAVFQLTFTNNGQSAICSITFKVDGVTITSKWNMDDAGNGQYKTPSWLNIPPGGQYTSTGMVVSGGTTPPTVTIVSTGSCSS